MSKVARRDDTQIKPNMYQEPHCRSRLIESIIEKPHGYMLSPDRELGTICCSLLLERSNKLIIVQKETGDINRDQEKKIVIHQTATKALLCGWLAAENELFGGVGPTSRPQDVSEPMFGSGHRLIPEADRRRELVIESGFT